MITKNSRIYVAGHKGLVGSSVLKVLREKGFKNIFFKTSQELDLRNQERVFNYITKIRPEGVIICAAKVGGIKVNNERKADFIYDNLSIQNNIIHGSFRAGVKNLVFLGSSCIYPKFSKQPIREKYLLTGELEPTNEFYAIAKIAGLKMYESYNRQYGEAMGGLSLGDAYLLIWTGGITTTPRTVMLFLHYCVVFMKQRSAMLPR